ncbi:MAG: NAD(+) synthase [Desulfovibrio sp.]|jgi:NAD+ synthase (glutamine-hydrolysing)|nr:NAD(+) synthase [Desulfovibrio sp.]
MIAALIQSNPRTGDIAGNMESLVLAAERAAAHADFCMAPEMALCGHNAGDILLRNGFADACRAVLNEAALRLARSKAPPLLLGAPVANPVPMGKSLQSGAVLLHQGQVRVIGRKILLPSGGIHGEAGYFEPGVACGVLPLKGWRFGVTLGEDAWNGESARIGRRLFSRDPLGDFFSAGGADCLINLCARPYEQGCIAPHEQMLARLAEHHRVPVLAVNMVGGGDSLVYYGQSLALDGMGRVWARAKAFAEDLLIVDLSGKQQTQRLSLGGELSPCPQVREEEAAPEEELWQAIVLGLKDFVHKCGFTSVLLGLSGGADSSLLAALAADAFGPEKVIALFMPAPLSNPGCADDALNLAKNLGLCLHVLPIAPLLDSFADLCAGDLADGLCGAAGDKIQARVRAGLLLTYADRFTAMPLCAVNKSEAAVGAVALYGDLCGGISPIGDLYKKQVYALCRHYNHKHPGAIPESVMHKTPSLEFASGRENLGLLPSGPVLDSLLKDILEGRENLEDLKLKGHDPEVVQRISSLVHKAEFKRRQAPPVLHLSAGGFGGGMRIPIASV